MSQPALNRRVDARSRAEGTEQTSSPMIPVERPRLDWEKLVYKMYSQGGHSQDGPTARPAYPGEKPCSLLRSPTNPAWFGDFFVCLFVFQDRVSLSSPGSPGISCVDQTGLELTEIHLPLPPECWEKNFFF